MPDLLVPDLDPATYERLRQAAADQGKSLAQTARDLLAEKLQPSKAEVWPPLTACAEAAGQFHRLCGNGAITHFEECGRGP